MEINEFEIEKNFIFNNEECSSKSGIYRFDIQDHFYVGSTKIFKTRWQDHIYGLKTSSHHSKKAQNAFDKYKSISFSIIEICTEDTIQEREQYWIDTLHPDLNITSVVDRQWKLSEESIEKRTKKINKKVYQYNSSGEFIREWDSIKEAAETLGLNRGGLSNAASEKQEHCGGFIWRKIYVDKVEPIKSKYRIILQFSLDGEFIKEWKSIKEILDSNEQFIRTNIYEVLRKARKSAYGFYWKYK